MTCLGTATADAETINHIIQTALDKLHQHFTGNATTTGSFGIEFAELTLQDTVGIFGFLFFFQLSAILRHFGTTLVVTMHTGSIGFSLVYFIRTENRFMEFSCNLGLRTCISCHILFMFEVFQTCCGEFLTSHNSVYLTDLIIETLFAIFVPALKQLLITRDGVWEDGNRCEE